MVGGMRKTGDPRAIPVLASLCEDPRFSICLSALEALGEYSQAEVQAHMWRLTESHNSPIRHMAIGRVKKSYPTWWGEELGEDACEAKCDKMLAERARKGGLPFDVRLSLARGIEGADTQVEVLADLLLSASTETQTNCILFGLAEGCLDRCGAQVEKVPLAQIVTNAAARMSLAQHLATRDSTTTRHAFEAVLLAAESSSNPSVRGCAKRALEELQREPEPDECTSRRRRR